MVNFHDPDTIQDLEKRYSEAFDAERFVVDESSPDMMRFMDAEEDLGIKMYENRTYESMCRHLGIPYENVGESIRCKFPFLNRYLSFGGLVPDDKDAKVVYEQLTEENYEELGWSVLQPRWHQLVAVAAMMDRFGDGKNVLLADGVGVGKTLECCMMMAYLRHLRIMQSQRAGMLYITARLHPIRTH